jgi:putative methyltransferase
MIIQVICLNRLVFLPYIHGLLRSYIDQYEPDLASTLFWNDPIFLDAPADEIANTIDCDVLAISCYVWNFKKQMKIAKLVVKKNPNTRVVVGGPHIPNNPDGFFVEHPYVDTIIHGEGEITFSNILKQIASNEYHDIPGTSSAKYHEPEKSLFGPKLPKNIQVDSPYYAGHLSAAIRKVTDMEYWVPWETNRGCPYSCSFCEWGSSLMNKVRTFSLERLIADIEYFSINQVENIYICDANFGMLPVDEDITDALVKSKELTGYPKQIRGSFAKNSNDRVFRITKQLMKAGMIYGTTLSMQSTDEKVLSAVDRGNIGIAKYKELQESYRAEGYHIYTELILGLPEETKDTFINGICELIESGNHEDVRVWELSILPNAPINQHIEKYKLRTITKNVFLELPKTALDEIERSQIVIGTSTMPPHDWVYCYLFALVIQALHCGYYTRYISEYLNREHNISYRLFYETLIADALAAPNSVLGGLLFDMESLLRDYPTSPSKHLMQKVHGFGAVRRNPSDWLWLKLCNKKDEFYKQVSQILSRHGMEITTDLIKFQQDMMLDSSYQPGKIINAKHAWREYFGSRTKLESIPVCYTINQTHTGVDDKYALSSEPSAFADAAVGSGFLVSRYRHYAHPMSELK